ncbi:MAG TPA: AAA family ATPase [Solirubrobacteraceae bacterium]|nr:AAA family ATPase [Solirubrobacteraceae bacterium]
MESGLHAPGPSGGLRGRRAECALLDDLVSAIRRGESRSVVLRGEAGIGKTALLEYLVASAADLRVLRAVGVDSEMELAFASLHQLCSPLLDRIGKLPAPQRRALEIVFGLSDGAAPDRFLVGLAVLSLFAAEVERRPLLCVVDDAQWLDPGSALTLAFVARRLLAERVGIVFAAREPGFELQQMDGLNVSGLRNDDARALLRSTLRFKLDERIVDRIIAEVRGNPLALLELPRGLTATQLAGGFGLPEAQALTGRIQESFVRRVSAVSDDARRLLLLAAAEPIGGPLLLLRTSEQLGIAVSAVDGETDGLLVLSQRVTFRHPPVRSAVYRTAALQERRAAHRALAAATDREFDSDRRAWHLAAAAAGPDEQVASELERSASLAQTRGGAAATAAFLQHGSRPNPRDHLPRAGRRGVFVHVRLAAAVCHHETDRGLPQRNEEIAMSATEAHEHVPFIDYENIPAPRDGIVVTQFITVRSVARSRAFYSEVLGGQVVLEENPCVVKLANSWVLMNPGGPPTPDKPDISVVNYEPGNTVSSFMNLRVADIQACYEQWSAKGAEFVTPPIDRGAEICCYMRDPDGYLIEVGQATGVLRGELAKKRPEDLPG